MAYLFKNISYPANSFPKNYTYVKLLIVLNEFGPNFVKLFEFQTIYKPSQIHTDKSINRYLILINNFTFILKINLQIGFTLNHKTIKSYFFEYLTGP